MNNFGLLYTNKLSIVIADQYWLDIVAVRVTEPFISVWKRDGLGQYTSFTYWNGWT